MDAIKADFLKKIGLKKLDNGFLIDPLNYHLKQKFNLKKFKYLNYCVGSSSKKIIFNKFSDKYPEWSSVNLIGTSSIYKKNIRNT